MTIQGRVSAPNNLLLCNSGAGPRSLSGGAQVRWRNAASCTPKCLLHIHAERCVHFIIEDISPTDPSLTAHPSRQLYHSDIGSLKINTTEPADASPLLNDHTSWLVRISESSNWRSNSEAPCGAKCACKWKRSHNSEVFLQREKRKKKTGTFCHLKWKYKLAIHSPRAYHLHF